MALTAKDLANVRPDVPAVEMAEKKGVMRGKKMVITVGFAPTLLQKIDDAAEKMGISRAAFINLACSSYADKQSS